MQHFLKKWNEEVDKLRLMQDSGPWTKFAKTVVRCSVSSEACRGPNSQELANGNRCPEGTLVNKPTRFRAPVSSHDPKLCLFTSSQECCSPP